MKRHAVCQLDEIPDGTIKALHIGGRDVLLVRKGKSVYALRDSCPHQGGQLSRGVLTSARVHDKEGKYRLIKCGEVVRCPWHNWEFDVTEGKCLDPSVGLRVATYEVQVEDGRIFVRM